MPLFLIRPWFCSFKRSYLKVLSLISVPVAALTGVHFLVCASPVTFFESSFQKLQPIPPEIAILSLAKGLEKGTGYPMSEVIKRQGIDGNSIAALSGAHLAFEIALGQPTTAHVASENLALAQRIQKLCSSPQFLIQPTRDIKGVQYLGAFKNVIAIAAGFYQGMGMGSNSIAVLITEGFRAKDSGRSLYYSINGGFGQRVQYFCTYC